MAQFRIKIKDELHVVEALTLEEGMLLRKHFDVTGVSAMVADDFAFIAGMTYIAIRRAHPEWEHARLMHYVNALTMDDFAAADPVEADPTPASADAAGT